MAAKRGMNERIQKLRELSVTTPVHIDLERAKIETEFIYESFMGTRFKGVIKEETKIGDYNAVIPMITGSAYLTGVATYLIDSTDPLKYGFLVG